MQNFHLYFLNMDISLIMTVTCMTICRDVAKTRMEGSVSQIFYLDFSFHFMEFRILEFEKNTKKQQKLPVFCHKMKTKA